MYLILKILFFSFQFFILSLSLSLSVKVYASSRVNIESKKTPLFAYRRFLMPKETSLRCEHLFTLKKLFLKNHIFSKKFTPALRNRLIDQYIKQLDRNKIYFLQQDVDYIRKTMTSIFNEIRRGDCKTVYGIYQLYLERVGQRGEFVEKTLKSSKYKVQKDLKFVIDPKLRSYAKTTQQLETFQKNYIQLQVATNIATGMSLIESKKQVLGFYQRFLSRLQKKKKEEVFAIFLNAFADSLDPHSYFFSKGDFIDFEIAMRLKFEGIGATLREENGFTVVDSLVPGGAADKSGLLKPQDKIIAVGQASGPMKNIVNMELKAVVKKIRGPKNSKVRLTILRKNQPRFTINLIRDEIKLSDKKASINYLQHKRLGQSKKIGIIELKSFYADMRGRQSSSSRDVRELLKKAKQNNIDGLVLDLSQNGGGVLEDAVKIAGLFIKKGNIVKQSAMGDLQRGTILRDIDNKVYFSGPLVVLTSRISASASEIVAGALKDYNRAIIVGSDHTFGKGTVQSVNNVPQFGGGAIKVTVSMFFIPGGQSTQHQGVRSHILLPSIFNTDEFGEKALDYSLKPYRVKRFTSSLKTTNFDKLNPFYWKPILPRWIKELSKKSSSRVAKNKKFQEIEKEAQDKKKSKNQIYISDVLENKDKDKDKDKKEDKKKDLTSAQNAQKKVKKYLSKEEIQEAITILGDLMELQGLYKKTKTVAN